MLNYLCFICTDVVNRGYAGQNFKWIKCWNCSWCCLHCSRTIVSCLFLLSALFFLSKYITSLLRHRLRQKQSWKYLKNNGQNFILISYRILQVLITFSVLLTFINCILRMYLGPWGITDKNISTSGSLESVEQQW